MVERERKPRNKSKKPLALQPYDKLAQNAIWGKKNMGKTKTKKPRFATYPIYLHGGWVRVLVVVG